MSNDLWSQFCNHNPDDEPDFDKVTDWASIRIAELKGEQP